VNIAEIEGLVREGADRLFAQEKKSNAFLSLSETAMAKAAAVMHIGAAFIKRGTIKNLK
jgi:hypothetical protein